MPHVGVDLAVDVFELVQIGHGLPVIAYVNVPHLAESSGVEEANLCRAVAENQVFAVGGEPPAVAVVVKRAQQAKAKAVVNEGNVGLPGELHQCAAPRGKAFGKVLLRHCGRLQRAPGREIFHAQRGAAVEAGALVQMPVDVDQALGVGAGIVGIGVDDEIRIVGAGRE